LVPLFVCLCCCTEFYFPNPGLFFVVDRDSPNHPSSGTIFHPPPSYFFFLLRCPRTSSPIERFGHNSRFRIVHTSFSPFRLSCCALVLKLVFLSFVTCSQTPPISLVYLYFLLRNDSNGINIDSHVSFPTLSSLLIFHWHFLLTIRVPVCRTNRPPSYTPPIRSPSSCAFFVNSSLVCTKNFLTLFFTVSPFFLSSLCLKICIDWTAAVHFYAFYSSETLVPTAMLNVLIYSAPSFRSFLKFNSTDFWGMCQAGFPAFFSPLFLSLLSIPPILSLYTNFLQVPSPLIIADFSTVWT